MALKPYVHDTSSDRSPYKKYGGYYGLETSESCQASSAVWLKHTILYNEPHLNVHEEARSEIRDLHLYSRGKVNFGGNNLTTNKSFKILMEAVGLRGTPILQTRSDRIIDQISTRIGVGLIIAMDTHTIAMYRGKIGSRIFWYVFDNTVGCMRFKEKKSLFTWLMWACKINREPIWVTGGDSIVPPTWRGAVLCSKPSR